MNAATKSKPIKSAASAARDLQALAFASLKGKNFKGIPEQERFLVQAYLALPGRQKMTPQQAYEVIRKDREEHAKRDLQRRIELQREDHASNAAAAISSLATVRDTLIGIAEDRLSYLQPEDCAAMAAALLKQAGTDLENALYVFGVLEKPEKPGSGYFSEQFPKLIK